MIMKPVKFYFKGQITSEDELNFSKFIDEVYSRN